MRFVVCDVDGTVTLPGLCNSYTKLPWWCGLWLIFVPPNKRMVKLLRSWQEKGDIIIFISARPKQLKGLTKLWFKIHRVAFNQLFLVGKGEGFEQRKLEIIQELEIQGKKIGLFIDDNPGTVKFLQKLGINARLP